MASISLKKLNKTFGALKVVHDIDLDIADKEFIILVGPSGCGKSTTLRMIAGLEEISGGELRIGEDVMNDVPSKDRDIAMVFQNYALYPHMTVYKNMAFGLELRKAPRHLIDTKVKVRVVGDLQAELVHDFFEGFAMAARANVHVKVMYGRSNHHKIEACFKAFARALRAACAKDRRLAKMLPSTKGLL